MKVPGLTLPPVTVNDLALVIPVTLYSPLKPEPAVPTGKLVLVTLLIMGLMNYYFGI